MSTAAVPDASPLATVSARGRALARTFAAAFSALAEHQRQHPAEYAQLMESVAGHIRSAAPLALLGPPPSLSGVRVPIDERDSYSVQAVGSTLMFALSRPDVLLSVAQADEMVRDIAAVAEYVKRAIETEARRG